MNVLVQFVFLREEKMREVRVLLHRIITRGEGSGCHLKMIAIPGTGPRPPIAVIGLFISFC